MQRRRARMAGEKTHADAKVKFIENLGNPCGFSAFAGLDYFRRTQSKWAACLYPLSRILGRDSESSHHLQSQAASR